MLLEVGNHLRIAVLENSEIRLFKVLNGVAVGICDRDIDNDDPGAGANVGSGSRLCAGSQREGETEQCAGQQGALHAGGRTLTVA